MGFVILLSCFIDRTELRQHRSPAAVNESHAATLRFEWTIVALLSAYILIEEVFESTMANSLADYVLCNSEFGIAKTESLYLLSFFWATYTFGGMFTVFVSLRLKPNSILILFQGITNIGTGILFLLVFPNFAGRSTAWIASGIIGLGISTLYPTGFTWAVRFIHLKYTHVSVLLVASCTGAMLPTYLVAPYVESSKTVLPSVSMGCVVILTCILFVMLFTTRNRRPIYDQEDEKKLTAAEDVGD